ncbi:FHA domain-containing protein [Sorangium sp. So ce1128]
MNGLKFLIDYPDGRRDELDVESTLARIGSGAHCEICLPKEHQVANEHVVVAALDGQIELRACASTPVPTVNGCSFTQTQLTPDSIVAIGQVKIKIRMNDGAGSDDAVKKKKSPLRYVLAMIAAPLALYVLLGEARREGGEDIPREVPPLWSAGAATCPERAPDQARAVARERTVLAEAKRERSPFVVQDGIAAVPLLETAAACLHVAGDQELVAQMSLSAAQLRAKINSDYRAHQVRLEHVLRVGDLRTAQSEAKTLLAMLEGQSGPYVVWLSNLDRRLTLKLGKVKGK